jgi:outer membrane receptor protein involved in Fe transport
MKRSIAAILLLLGGMLSAQTSRGTVNGLVTDQSGAAVVGTDVDLRNTATNVVRNTKTNESGLYRFDAVDPGPYELTVTAAGFKAAKTQSIQIAASQVASVDIKLELGEQKSVVVVEAEAAQLQMETPVRGGTLSTVAITELPVANRNSVTLALTLPGVTTNQRSFGGGSFSVNGGRGRSNNFLIDGTENNDISVAGQAFAITLPDLVQETVVQTTNFDSEYGRAGGGVVNVVTKSGTNEFHGMASYLLDSTIDDSISNTQGLDPNVLLRGHPPAGTEQIFAGTFGGPILKNRTFFFGGFQEDRQNAAGSFTVTVPSAAGRAVLNSLFPKGTNANVDNYNAYTGTTNATSQFFPVALGNGRPDVQFGTATVGYPNKNRDRLFSIKIDHRISDNDLLSGRYSYDEPIFGAAVVDFPGFDTSNNNRYQNAVLNETHIFSPSLTNELRLPFNRITLDFPVNTTNPLGPTLASYAIAGVTGFGVATNLPQGRIANNYGLQDTFTYTHGAHSIRGGIDLLDQRSRQFAPIVGRGLLTYNASTGFTGFANFVDDFGGSGGGTRRDFGSPAYYPALFRQAYFVQDRWRAGANLTVTMGLRYEYFGVPENVVRTAAYTGLFNVDPITLAGPYSQPSKVAPDKNNFSPSIGLAYSPAYTSGMLGKIFGDHKSVIRTGYQIGYDSFFNNIASNAATSAPNVVATLLTSTVSTTLPRGLGSVAASLPTVPRPLSPLDSQSLIAKNLVNPYYQRSSFGIQRELRGNWILDMSYVWSKGTKLFVREDSNPQVPAALRIGPATFPVGFAAPGRLDNLQGSRVTVTNGGSSYYNAGQASLTRRFSSGVYLTLAYTHAKLIDYGSDIFSNTGNYTLQQASVPAVYGGQKLEKGPSLFDRPNRLVNTFYYQLPFFKNQQGFTGRLLGGWELSGIYTYESGVPYSILNGADADGIGGNLDRPDFNPAGQKGVRAVPLANGTYVNPDNNNAPIDPKTAEYIGLLANSGRTGNLGRNTERANPTDNLNTNILKVIQLKERFRLEFRTEFYNILNHPQYGQLSVSPFSPSSAGNIASTVITSPAGRFQNQTFLDGGQRVIRYQLKFIF